MSNDPSKLPYVRYSITPVVKTISRCNIVATNGSEHWRESFFIFDASYHLHCGYTFSLTKRAWHVALLRHFQEINLFFVNAMWPKQNILYIDRYLNVIILNIISCTLNIFFCEKGRNNENDRLQIQERNFYTIYKWEKKGKKKLNYRWFLYDLNSYELDKD